MDVGVWLRSLGLGQYEAAFRDNAIDVDVLADLTEGDLAQLGLPLGDRKRLLRAIAGLAGPATRQDWDPPKPVRFARQPYNRVRPSADRSPSCFATSWARPALLRS
jgi:SAM domain (Sterile alpha motif)